MFDAGNIKDLFEFFCLYRFGGRKTIINNGNLFCRDVPVFYKIIPGRAADRHDTLSFSDIMGQHFFDVKHPEPVILDRNVILGKIVHHSHRKYGKTAKTSAVGGKQDAEVVLFPVDSEGQNKQTVKH